MRLPSELRPEIGDHAFAACTTRLALLVVITSGLALTACDDRVSPRQLADDVPDVPDRTADTAADTVDDTSDGEADAVDPSCTLEHTDAVQVVDVPSADVALALHPRFDDVRQHPEARAATFSDRDGNLFGWVVSIPAETLNLEAANSDAILEVVTESGNVVVTEFSQPYDISDDWDRADRFPLPVPDTVGVRSTLRATYGEGTPNETTHAKDPSLLRDEILSALADTLVDTNILGRSCSEHSIGWNIHRRTGGERFIVSGVVTCTDAATEHATLRSIFRDVMNATHVAPAGYRPLAVHCETLEPRRAERSETDFLLVVDNSASMVDHLGVVGPGVRALVSQMQLLIDESDIRIGVTTSDAFLGEAIQTSPERARHGPDEQLDLTTGLRKPGFIPLDTRDGAELILRNVTTDAGCDLSDELPGAAPGDNLCGHHAERPLESGLRVLQRVASDTRDDYSLRDDATLIVFWFSDEETHALKDGESTASPEDPRFRVYVDEMVAGYETYEAIGYAVVGDDGVGNRGACARTPLGVDPDAIDASASDGANQEGAQPGRSLTEVARELGGASASICNEDLDAIIEAMYLESLGIPSPPELRGYPVPSTTRVEVNGRIVPRGDTDGWTYNPTDNAIVFRGSSRPDASATIDVSYRMWRAPDAD